MSTSNKHPFQYIFSLHISLLIFDFEQDNVTFGFVLFKINHCGIHSRTVLFYAMQSGNFKVAKILLDHGADPSLRGLGPDGRCDNFFHCSSQLRGCAEKGTK